MSNPKQPLPRQSRKRPAHPIEQHNPFGEWRNPHYDLLLELRGLLERTAPDYDASAAFIRSRRPSVPSKALQFWNTVPARAHAMIALLSRGNRTMAKLHEDLGLAHDKIYSYLPRWNVEWRNRPTEAVAQGPDGERVLVAVECWHDDISATVRLSGFSVRARARWLPDAWEFSLDEPLTHKRLVTPAMAARLLNLEEATVKEILPVAALTTRRKPLIALNQVELVLPPSEWRITLQGVSHDLNHCRCAFFDPYIGGCSLKPERPLPDKGTAQLCEDYLETDPA